MDHFPEDISVEDFLSKESSSIWVVVEPDTQAALTVIEPDGGNCIAFFSTEQNADEFLVAWGEDPGDWIAYELESSREVMGVFLTIGDDIQHFTLDPPLKKNKKFRVLDIKSFMDWVASKGYNPE